MKNYTREFPKSLISNPLSDFQNYIWRKKLEKILDFRKSEYTRIFGFAVKKLYLRIFEVADFKGWAPIAHVADWLI